MRKIIFSIVLALSFMKMNAQSAVAVYARFTLYSGSLQNEITGGVHDGQILLNSYSNGEEQTLNIGSQSSGAGAGKISFNPVAFTKPVSVNSPQFSSMLASGTPFQKVDFYFYNAAGKLFFQQTLKLVAFKTIQRSVAPPCPSPNCPGLIEIITMQYGGLVNAYYPPDAMGMTGKPIIYGWDGIKNIRNDDPGTSLIKSP